MIGAVTSSTLVDLVLGPCPCKTCGEAVWWDGKGWVRVVGQHLAVPHRCKRRKETPCRP